MSSNFLWQTPQTADTPTWSPVLASLGTGSYSLSSTIDNTSGLFTDAVFWLNLSSSVTAGSAPAGVFLWFLDSWDGTNFPSPNSAAVPPATLPGGSYAAVGGAGVQVLQIGGDPPLSVRPVKFKLLLLNSLGVSFPAGGITAALYRFGLQAS